MPIIYVSCISLHLLYAQQNRVAVYLNVFVFVFGLILCIDIVAFTCVCYLQSI